MNKKSKSLKVGDRVVMRLGNRKIKARIVEDRGFIGKGGRHIVRIEQAGANDDPSWIYEVPAEEVAAE